MSKSTEPMQSYSTYDYSKIITKIEVSTIYISALQKICSDMILKEEGRSMTVGETFKKFENIVAASQKEDLTEEDKEALPKLDAWESDLYTLFSLLQQLKFKASEQGLEIKTETTATQAEVAELSKMVASGKDVSEKMKDLESKLRIVR